MESHPFFVPFLCGSLFPTLFRFLLLCFSHSSFSHVSFPISFSMYPPFLLPLSFSFFSLLFHSPPTCFPYFFSFFLFSFYSFPISPYLLIFMFPSLIPSPSCFPHHFPPFFSTPFIPFINASLLLFLLPSLHSYFQRFLFPSSLLPLFVFSLPPCLSSYLLHFLISYAPSLSTSLLPSLLSSPSA